MKSKPLLTVSILLNVALVAVVVFLFTRQPEPLQSSSDATGQPAAAQRTHNPSPTIPTTAVTNVFTQSLDWRMVESEDYRKYIANLRSIGCPEETIRDIIIADVNKLFEQRRRKLAWSTNKFQFWKAGNSFESMMDPERTEQTQALNKEKRELLRELLGVVPEEKPDFLAAFNPFGTMLDFLSPAKQNEVMDVYMKFQAKQVKLFEDGASDEDSMKEMRKLQKEMEAEVAGLMSPQDFEEYQLRMSGTAMSMRMQLGSFNPSEQEFRDIFALQKKYDDDSGMMMGTDMSKEEREKVNAMKKDLDSQMKSLLGDARYAEYERAQDWNYEQIYRATEKAGLPQESAVKVYDMKKTAEAEVRKLREDKSLTPEQRSAALKAIRAETEKSVQSVMGDKTWASYQKQSGAYWLKSISPDEKPATPAPTLVE